MLDSFLRFPCMRSYSVEFYNNTINGASEGIIFSTIWFWKSGKLCKAKNVIRFQRGKFLSEEHFCAPLPSSSAGWNNKIIVPVSGLFCDNSS
jgi:hypothetical protein